MASPPSCLQNSSRASVRAISARTDASAARDSASRRWTSASGSRVSASAEPSSKRSAPRSSAAGGSSRARLRYTAAIAGDDLARASCAASAEHRDGPLVAGAGREKEVGGRLFRRQVMLVEQPGGAPVGLSPLDGRHVQVHGVANECVQEGERGRGPDDLDLFEPAGRVGGIFATESGELGDEIEVGAVAEHGEGTGERLAPRQEDATVVASRNVILRQGRSPVREGSRVVTGATPSAERPSSSSQSSRGLPPLAARQAEVNSGSGAVPRTCSVSRSAAATLRGAGRSNVERDRPSARRPARDRPRLPPGGR